MTRGQTGTLLGFAFQVIAGALLAAFPNAPLFPAIMSFVGCATLVYVAYHNRSQLITRIKRVTTNQLILLVSVGLIWIGVTASIYSFIRMISNGELLANASVRSGANEGPLRWSEALTIDGGFGQDVKWLLFRGYNASDGEVEIKSANLISGITGEKLPLEIEAPPDGFIPLNQAALIPKGAQISLRAQFGLPNGLDPRLFLDSWRQFSLNIEDDRKTYRIQFTETQLAVFFPGLAGPRVTKKSAAN